MSLPTIPQTSKQQLRHFGLMLGLLLPLVFSLLWPWLHQTASPTWPILLGSLFVAMGLIAPKRLQQPYKLWMLLGHGLGWINSHLILGLILYLPKCAEQGSRCSLSFVLIFCMFRNGSK